ncbi:hypothetical protein Nepgr_004802 [Nepenthes gracilis]|uniref:Uncharacterized protein n=1 Tax=Nepenthes gracilis TaxID=150966 RepID=A0AAD3S1X6_NEPGR|nr:hypothetical protein Nepgr_004802 [Nepenthes gracilis]
MGRGIYLYSFFPSSIPNRISKPESIAQRAYLCQIRRRKNEVKSETLTCTRTRAYTEKGGKKLVSWRARGGLKAYILGKRIVDRLPAGQKVLNGICYEMLLGCSLNFEVEE